MQLHRHFTQRLVCPLPPPAARVGIVGGGVLGMTLALRLTARGHRVTVIEASARPGGLASSQSIGGYTWDRFYHVILLSDRHLRGLLDELGLADRLRWGVTRTGFYTNGRLHSLSTSLEFLSFPPLSLIDKVRLAGTILYASQIKDWKRLEAIPVTDWLRRLSGQRTFERIWLPLLKAKLGENYRHASAAFIWAIIARMYAARRSGLKREMFGFVEGGYAVVLSRLQSYLDNLGIEVCSGRAAERVIENGAGADVLLEGGETRSFDHVVLTAPCGKVAGLCPDLADAERNRLNGVIYQGIACASVLLTRPLAGYYVTNITDSGVPFTAVIEMTALVDSASLGGHSLVYLPSYLTQDDPFWNRDDASIREEFLTALERMYPDFRRDQVVGFQVARAREVLALSTLYYSDRLLPPVETSLPHVFLVNSAQIAQGTLNLNETVGLANRQAEALAPYLTLTAAPAALRA